ncbi:MAG: pentapeptide repeat-containing protein [Candidatus Chromulinivorax sp.]|nr:pentapeptide repeat-containing protein [Candidatus Chromulinivorax sp.]
MKFIVKSLLFYAIILFQSMLLSEMPHQVEAFKESIQNGTKIPNCANCDFRGTQDLAGVDAHGAHLPGVTFQPCVPNDQNQNSMMLCVTGQGANLTGINLADANLFSSCLDGAMADNADFSKADVSNSSLRYVSLKNAKVSGIITTNSTFCNAIMPDGKICTDTWTGQGVTIACNCTAQDQTPNPIAATNSPKAAAPAK